MSTQRLLRSLLALLLILAIGLAVFYRDQFNAEILERQFNEAGWAAPLIFMAVYAAATVLFLPGSVLTLIGGALFGPLWGTLYNLTGATIGAGLSFLAARTLAADWIKKKAGKRTQQLITGVEAEGWRFIAFVRLVPLFPFNLLNYALGLTRIPFWTYLIATWVFMIPGGLAYTWLGHAGKEAVTGGQSLIQNILIAVALVAAAAFLPRLVSRIRQGKSLTLEEFRKLLEQSDPPLILDVRNKDDFMGKLGHIDGALNIPLEELPQRVDELESWRERTITLVCTTDRRSSKAALQLLQQGFSNVHVVLGGMTEWNRQSLPVQRSEGADTTSEE